MSATELKSLQKKDALAESRKNMKYHNHIMIDIHLFNIYFFGP
jgi:hypothetical protein